MKKPRRVDNTQDNPYHLNAKSSQTDASSPSRGALVQMTEKEQDQWEQAIAAYDQMLESKETPSDPQSLNLIHKPFIRLRRIGRAKEYVYSGQITLEQARQRRQKERIKSRYWHVTICIAVLIAILFLIYKAHPLQRLQELLFILGY